jgi:hypothetical protein
MFKKLFNRMTPMTSTVTVPAVSQQNIAPSGGHTASIPWTNTVTTTVGTTVAGTVFGNVTAAVPSVPYTINSAGYANMTINGATARAAAGLAGVAGLGGVNGMFVQTPPNHIMTFSNPAGQEIVRLNLDGSVSWPNGIDIDAASEAFGKSLQMGAEMRSGISKSVKLKMRDSVFEDLINIAKERGSLTAEDLTYLLEASKIVEKLKG